MRTCVGCREKAPASTLLRIVAVDGILTPDPRRRLPGRGAWLCSLACFDVAVRRKGFERAWRRSVATDALTTLRIAVEGVITNMEELSVVGPLAGSPTLTKG